jgi:mannose-6-phosphate isomerase
MPGKYEFNVASKDKTEVFQQAAAILLAQSFRLIDFDTQKPWGFYLSVDETQAPEFIKEFYGDIELKFLGIEPGKRLSWQYHHRRAEIWHCLAGEFDLVTSQTNTEDKSQNVETGQVVNMPQGMRHRGVGLNQWALIAEIWQHTDPKMPSDEADIVRVQDDFGRN